MDVWGRPLSHHLFFAGLISLICGLDVASGQVIPDAPGAAPTAGTAVQAHRDARKRLAEGRFADAVEPLKRALSERPFDREILSDLIRAAKGDEEARILWTYTYALSALSADGKVPLDGELAKLITKDDRFLFDLAGARAEAASEIVKVGKALAERGKKAGRTRVGTRWAARVFWELAHTSPAVHAAYAGVFQPWNMPYVADSKPITAALESVMTNGLSKPTLDESIRAAQILIGLAAQAGFGKDLRGPTPPDMKSVGDKGRAGLAEARRRLITVLGAPLTLEQLQGFSEEERSLFTESHRVFSNPGVGITPETKYRVETICGYETLVGALSTLDLHHQRLVNWYGVDPFKSRQGLVRIVPEHAGLESESTPFWWAGGFQSGDTTTVQFSVGNIEGLGRTLTHELTHRFDGVVFPFMPAWMAEGRAVWTGSAYASSDDQGFVPNHANFGTIEGCIYKGYGDFKTFAKLVEGTPDDYRDNYIAGYALWVFLDTWIENGTPLFKNRLKEYMAGFPKGRTKPRAFFEAHFCDESDGRPKTLEDFHRKFAEFFNGFYWRNRAPWTSRYTQDVGERKPFTWVYDGPTWSVQRGRAEPWFGQDQARAAGRLLIEANRKPEALQALAWALEVDEWSPEISRPLHSLLMDAKLDDLSWCLRALESTRLHDSDPLADQPPFARDLGKFTALLRAYREAVALLNERRLPHAAAVLAADANRLAALAGDTRDHVGSPEPVADLRHPLDEMPRPIGLYGFEEDGLTDYEEKRVKGLWFVEEDGDLNVGRDKPREGTGTVDRGAWQRHAFTRTREWQAPGRYLLRTRIAFTSSVVSGAIIVGMERADRYVRFNFNGGDFAYSVGLKEEAAKFDSIGWGFSGRRGRDGGLGSTPGGRTKFDGEKSSFIVELLVDGPEIHAFVEGDWVGTYQEIEGRNIEGFIGFALNEGAILVSEATVQRLDRTKAMGRDQKWPSSLDITRDSVLKGDAILNRRLRGIPHNKEGTLVLWFPPADAAALEKSRASELEYVKNCVLSARGMLDRELFPQPVVALLPENYGDETLKDLKVFLEGDGLQKIQVLLHKRTTPILDFGTANRPASPLPTVLMVDPWGVIRVYGDFFAYERRLPSYLRHLPSVWRGRS